jgi:hypothetical protein
VVKRGARCAISISRSVQFQSALTHRAVLSCAGRPRLLLAYTRHARRA